MAIETRTQHIWLDEEGIIHARIKAHAEVTLADAVESIRTIASVTGGVRRPAVIDLSAIKSMDREARRYYAGPETAKIESAAALVLSSPLTKAIGNFFMGLNKPLIPTRLVRSEAEGLQWLRALSL